MGWFGHDIGKNAVKELEPTVDRIIDNSLKKIDKLDRIVDNNLPKLENVLLNLQERFGNIIDSTAAKASNIADTLSIVGSILGLSLTFSSAVFGLVKLYSAFQGRAAEDALMKLGIEISKSLQTSADCMERQVNLKTQEKFGIHVHDYISLCSKSDHNSWVFVYHPGTDWHPTFFKKLTVEPLPQLASVFSDLDTMLLFLSVLRKVAGPEITFRILIPSTQIFAVPSEVNISPSLIPLTLECEKNGSGSPYVHVNMPGAPASMFKHVINVSRAPKPESWNRWNAANSAAWGTAVPVAAAGSVVAVATIAVAETTVLGAAAMSFAVGTASGVAVVAAPVVLVVGLPVLLAGAGVAAWAAGMASKESVRKGHKREDEKMLKKAEEPFIE